MALRILFFTENYVFGGGSKYFIDLINIASSVADDVVVITNPGALAPQELKRICNPVKVYETAVIERSYLAMTWFGDNAIGRFVRRGAIFLSPLILLANVLRFSWRLNSIKPDVVISCNGGYPAAESCLTMILAARIKKIPAILSVVSMPQKRRWFLFGYDNVIDSLVSMSASAVISNSMTQLDALRKVRGIRADKLHRIFNGITDINKKPITSLKQYSQKNQVVLGVVCRLDKMKGLDFLIEAIALLVKQHDVVLNIIGEGPEYKNLIKRTQELDLSHVVQFLGFVGGDLSSKIASFDIFVFPSLWEGLPYSVLEALRAGLPIVSTDVGGIPEAIRHMREGVLVKPASADALAEGISLLLQNPDLGNQLSKNARKRFESEFTLEKMQDNFRQVIDKVCMPAILEGR